MLTKSEIEFLLERARSGRPASTDSTPDPSFELFDFQGAGNLSAGQISSLLALHTNFASHLAHSMSTLLASECGVKVTSVEQMPYSELSKSVPEGAIFETVQIHSPEGQIFVRADVVSILPMIDLMLGGEGAAPETLRALTEVEQEIFKPVIEAFVGELQSIWAPLQETTLRFEHYGQPSYLIPAAEKVLVVSFEIQLGNMQGVWNLVLPKLVSTALTRQVEQQLSRAESERSEENQRRLKERVLESRFKVELFLPPSTVSVRKLARLKPGQVVVLKPRATDPIHFNVEGINLFQASPVSCGTRRGAQIKRTLTLVRSKEKESR